MAIASNRSLVLACHHHPRARTVWVLALKLEFCPKRMCAGSGWQISA
ncbi:MAG TPA: hypothetical protein VKB24_01615 [Candidatus Acidoferrum sp.]|nr:hypothetical protein [Candidatus Acidoferrum sp.]